MKTTKRIEAIPLDALEQNIKSLDCFKALPDMATHRPISW